MFPFKLYLALNALVLALACRLVSLLDDRSWEVLAELSAPEALAVIDEVADR